jgi:prevent-host-death family protein
MWLWRYQGMKMMAADKFKDVCLETVDEVAASGSEVLITKRGRPVARLVPYESTASRQRSLVGSVLSETGDPFHSGESWDVTPS